MVKATTDNRYNIYMGMRKRCYRKKNKDYYRYGAKGIGVCDRWMDNTKVKIGTRFAGRGCIQPVYVRKGFLNFCEDMGERPKGTSIDRIDNTKGYSPDNCRWATQKEQANNRSTCVKTPSGETLHQYAERVGIPYSLITARLSKGWTFEDATTIKPGERNKLVKYRLKNGETLGQYAKRAGIPRPTVYYRIQRGWTPEEAVGQKIRKK